MIYASEWMIYASEWIIFVNEWMMFADELFKRCAGPYGGIVFMNCLSVGDGMWLMVREEVGIGDLWIWGRAYIWELAAIFTV